MNFKAAFVFRERRQLEAWTRTQRNVFSSFLCAEHLRSVRVCGLPPDFVQRKQRTLSPSALNNNPREFVLLPRRSFLSHSSSVSNTLARLETEIVFVFFYEWESDAALELFRLFTKEVVVITSGQG